MLGRSAADAALRSLFGAAPPVTMARPQFSFPAVRQPISQGSLKPQKRSAGRYIEDKLGEGLRAAGMAPHNARRIANKTFGAFNDLTPVGNVTGAQEGYGLLKQGITKGDVATGALGLTSFLLSVMPFGGQAKKRPLQSLLKDNSGAIRAWHGTNEIFDQFDPKLSNGLYYFADNPDIARIYGSRLHAADLDFTNPLTVPAVADPSHIPSLAERAKAAGHDGLVIEHIDDVGGQQRQLVAFNPPRIVR